MEAITFSVIAHLQ
jgi:hypothetical protein